MHGAINRHLPFVHARLDHADDPVGIEIAHLEFKELGQVTRGRRQYLAHEVCGRLEQYAGGFAGRRVAHDHATVRVGRLLGDAGQFQCLRVHRDDVAAARNEHGIIRRHGVELEARRHPAFLQDAFVPAGRRHDPFSRLGARNALGDRLLYVRDVARAEKLHGRPLSAPKSWCRWVSISPGTTVFPASPITCVPGPICRSMAASSPTARKRSILDRNGLGDAPIAVDGNDIAATQNEIGGLGEGGCRKRRARTARRRRMETSHVRRMVAVRSRCWDCADSGRSRSG